jgi:hypothetical protein
MSSKVSRRRVLKMFGLAGVALAAAPVLAKASAFSLTSGPQKSEPGAAAAQLSIEQSRGEPLVLLVRGDKVTGYRGLEEMPVQDASLAGMLHGRFNSKGASS